MILCQKGVPGTKCRTKNPKPAANIIETAIISRPEAIPPSLKAIILVIFINIIHKRYICNCINYLIHPNLFFIVKRSRKIEVNEIIKPNIINGLDFSLTIPWEIFFERKFFLSLLIRFENGLFTTEYTKVINLKL